MLKFIYKETVSALARLMAKPGRLLLVYYLILLWTPFDIASDQTLVKPLIWAFLILVFLLPPAALLYKKRLLRKQAYFAACLSRYVLTIVNFGCFWYLLSYINIQTGGSADLGYYVCQTIQLLVIIEEYQTLKSLIQARTSER